MRTIITVLLLLGLNARAQVKFIETINTGIPSSELYNNIGNSRIFTSYNDDSIYLYGSPSRLVEKDMISSPQTVYVISKDGNANALYHFQFPESSKGQSLSAVCVLHENLIILTFKDVYVYTKEQGEFVLFKKLDNKYKFDRINILNDSTLLFSVTYIFHPKSQKEKCVLSTVNMRTLDYEKTIFPTINGIAYSFFSPTWVAANNNRIALVDDPMKYKIQILDSKLNKEISIEPKIDDWQTISNDTLDYIMQTSGKDALDRAQKSDVNISRVLSVFFINKDHLLVLYKLKGIYKDCYFDIIALNENGYTVISEKNLMKKEYDDSELIAGTNFLLNPIKDSHAEIIPLSDSEFALRTTNYLKVNADENIADYYRNVAGNRANENKTIGLVKIRWK